MPYPLVDVIDVSCAWYCVRTQQDPFTDWMITPACMLTGRDVGDSPDVVGVPVVGDASSAG